MPKYPYYFYLNETYDYLTYEEGHQSHIQQDYEQSVNAIDNGQQQGRYGYRRYGDVYVGVRDETGKVVDANYATVNYRENFNGVQTELRQVVIPGRSIPIQLSILLQDTDIYNPYNYSVEFIGAAIEDDGSNTPPGVCDAAISTVIIDKKESGPGRNDAQITVKATSSAGDIQYSLNNVTWQTSPIFTNLSGGGYTSYIKDAMGCTASQNFFVYTLSSLLVSDPSVDLGNGNVSRWNAAFNPIVFTYQRRDFSVTNIISSSGQTTFVVDGALSITNGTTTVAVAKDDKVYIKAGAYDGVYDVEAVDLATNRITVKAPHIASPAITGFININKLRPYYQVNTQITYQDKLTNKTQTIGCVHRPNLTGETRADISSFLQSLLRGRDEAIAGQVNYRDDNLSASYTIRYAEMWYNPVTNENTTPVYVDITTPYYVTFSARQLGDAYGGNMAAYVPFKTVDAPSKRARWITDFAEPAYTPGYPFDIGFIYGDDLAGLNIYAHLIPLDINRKPLTASEQTTYLLNEDRSFLLQQDSSKLVIIRQPVSNEPITTGLAQRIGLNRLRINNSFVSGAHYFNIELKYKDAEDIEHSITQPQTIRIDDAVEDQSVYLRWIGLTGSWNYYRFVYNQEVTLDVQNAVIIKNYIHDWANQDAMEEVISKSAGLKMKVMAEDLRVSDIKGLQSIKYSPKVQMLVNKNPAKWQTIVLNTATFAEYETRNGQAPFSVTFNLPALNIQTQ